MFEFVGMFLFICLSMYIVNNFLCGGGRSLTKGYKTSPMTKYDSTKTKTTALRISTRALDKEGMTASTSIGNSMSSCADCICFMAAAITCKANNRTWGDPPIPSFTPTPTPLETAEA